MTRKERRALRRLVNEQLATTQAAAWAKVSSALRKGYDRPVNRQARKELLRRS